MPFDDPPPAGRVIGLKRIVDPEDPDPHNPTNYVDVPTIVSIRIMDGYIPQTMIRSYYSIDGNDIRQSTIHTVKNQTTNDGQTIQTDDSIKLDVERVLMCQHVNADWIEWHYFNNGDPAPLPAPIDPAYDPTLGHVKSHVVRYNQDNKNDPNSTPWIDVELADVVRIIGNRKERETDAAQVAIVSLANDGGDTSFSDPSDPFKPAWADKNYYQTVNWGFAGILPLDTNGNPDPVRLDPFTNIVNVSWNQLLFWTIGLSLSASTVDNLGMSSDGTCTASGLGWSVTANSSNMSAYRTESISQGPGILENSIDIAIADLFSGAAADASQTSRRRTQADGGSSAGWVPFNGANTVTFTLTLTLPDTNADLQGKKHGYNLISASAQLSNAWKSPTSKNTVTLSAFDGFKTMSGAGTVTGTVTATIDPPSITVTVSV